MAESGQDASAPAQVAARTRALYKKGQKCILPISEKDEEGQDKVVYYAGMVSILYCYVYIRLQWSELPEIWSADYEG